MDARSAILAAARQDLRADTAEEGFGRIRALTGVASSDAEFADAIAAAVLEGLIRDPVRLEQGSLQCCWHLELTPGACAKLRSHDTSEAECP